MAEDTTDDDSRDRYGVGRRTVLEALSTAAAVAASATGVGSATTTETVTSPNDEATVTFELDGGVPTYAVSYRGTAIVDRSPLGFEFADQPAVDGDLAVTDTTRTAVDDTWEPVWGRTATVRDHCEELVVDLRETTGPERALRLVFRAYDDGVAFRYRLSGDFGAFAMTAENTEFNFANDADTWWIPNNWNSYEYLYQHTKLSEVSGDANTDNHDKKSDADGFDTPATMAVSDDCYVAVHEAALLDYAGLTLVKQDVNGPRPGQGQTTDYVSDLVPLPDGTKVRADAPHATPWRAFLLGTSPGELAESNLLVNLCPPTAYDDTSWIEPQQYCGVWWEMHVGKSKWPNGEDDGVPVGARTANVKRYMDLASDLGVPTLLAEGWNADYEAGDEMTYTASADHFDHREVWDYGQSLTPSVDFVAHNETMGGVDNYEAQMDEAYAWYEDEPVTALKTGYVGEDGCTLDGETHNHHDQAMVNHYHRSVRTAAAHELMVNAHEPIKPTGLRRTFPNFMTREGVSGMEYQNFRDEGNPPEHTTILPFTRQLAGPMDYTPGIFDLTYRKWDADHRVHNTRARELAHYVTTFSGLQMVADLVGNYPFDGGAFQFVRDVPVAWDETRYLDGAIGDYVVVARRRGEEWFVGAAADEVDRTLAYALDFLDPSTTYDAHVYQDGYGASTAEYPYPVAVRHFEVTGGDELVADLPGGGGQAVHLTPASGDHGPIPAPYDWTTSASVGDPGYDAAAFDVRSTGTDMWTDADEYTAVYEADAVGPSATVQVAVTAQEATDPWAKSGVVVRNDATAAGDSLGYVALSLTPDYGVQFAWDADGDGYLDSHALAGDVAAPVHLRIERDGDAFAGAYSTDGGSTWTRVDSATVGTAAPAQDAAFHHCAHDSTAGVATFDDVRVDDRIPLTRPVPAEYERFATGEAEFGRDTDDGALHVNAQGADLWADTDEYGALVDADALGSTGTVTCRVRAHERSDPWCKAGLMVRNDATGAGGSRGYVTLTLTAGNGLQLAWDADDDGRLDSAVHADEYAPRWLRLEKHDDGSFTGAYSRDGADWTTVDTVAPAGVADAQDAALVQCSHASDPAMAEFDAFDVR